MLQLSFHQIPEWDISLNEFTVTKVTYKLKHRSRSVWLVAVMLSDTLNNNLRLSDDAAAMSQLPDETETCEDGIKVFKLITL